MGMQLRRPSHEYDVTITWTGNTGANNVISIAELTPLERRQIKDALRVVETVQHSVALKFRTVLIA